MWNQAIKNLAAHKLRLALTAVAVVLGVAFMAGTLVLTGTIKHDIDGLFNRTTSGYSVVVRATTPYSASGVFSGGGGGGGGAANSRPLTPESLIPNIRSAPGVSDAVGSLQGQVELVSSEGKAIKGRASGAPTVALAWIPNPQMSALKIRSGHGPTAPGQLAIDAATASRDQVTLGARVNVIGTGAPQPFTVVGIFGFGSSQTIAGATIVAFDAPVAQQLFGSPGYFDQIDVAANPGTNTDTLIDAVANRLPSGFEAVNSATVAQENANTVNGFIGTFNDILLAFAFIALFVGAFLIFNTFSILVGQRTRELALLRALGASRRQVRTSVILEAMFTGLAGAITGVVVGILLAAGLLSVLRSYLDLSSTGLVISPGTIVVSLLVGTLITVVAALGPSLRASRVPPVAAMREDAAVIETSLRRRAIIGSSVTAIGLLALLGGLFAGSSIALVGVGAGLTFIGVAMLVPFIASPVARAFAAPIAAVTGITGRLSQENAARNPRRTGATATTLMIGLALVAAIATLATSATTSFGHIFTSTLKSDYVVTSTNNTFSRSAADAVKGAPGVTAVSPFTEVEMHIGNASHKMSAIDPVTGPQLIKINMVTGSTDSLAKGEVLVNNNVAKSDHLAVGSPITMGFSATGSHTYTVGGTFKTNQLLDNYIASIPVVEAATNQLQYEAVLVKVVKPSSSAQAAVGQALSGYPQLTVKTTAQFVSQQKQQIQGFLRFVYVLLALSIIIGLIGVVNTLLLSVLERTHEIGLLRAVGMLRRQVRSMIRGEAVVVSVLGAVLGVLLGVAFGAAIVGSLSGSGITQIAIPWSTIIVVLVLALLFGLFAAIFPARRAARLDVLQAITTT
jgi:putative ABC transport system permease protein